jgi:hypothetical protein
MDDVNVTNPGIAALAGNTGDDELNGNAAPVPVPVVAGPAQTTVPATTQGVPISTLTAGLPDQPKPGGISESPKTQLMRQAAQNANRIISESSRPSAPSMWARALIGGFQTAISGLGDARDAGKGNPSGWIQGVTSTLGNRDARISAANQQAVENARKDKELEGLSAEQQARIQQMAATTAHETAQAVHESKVWSQLDDESKKKAIAQDKSDLDADQSSDLPAPILARDVDSDELMKQIKAGTLDPTKAHRYLTGQKEVGENPDGTPIMRDVYTVTGQADGPQKITPEFAKRYNAAFPDRPPLATDGTGTTDWHTLKYNQQLVSNVETAKLVREDNERKLGIEREKEETTEESNDLQKDPRYLKFMGAAKLNPIVAYQMAANDPTMTKDYPRLLKDFSVAAGPNVWDEYVKNAGTNHSEAQKALDKMENDPAEISGDKAAGVLGMAKVRLADPLTPPEERARWMRIQAQATEAQRIDTQQKQNSERAKDALNSNDIDAAAQMLVDGTMYPDELRANRRPEVIIQVMDKAQQLAAAKGIQDFSAARINAYAKIAQSEDSVKFFRNANSLTNDGGTLQQLTALGAQLPQGQFPPINSWKDFINYEKGGPEVKRFQTMALGVADDYGQIMGAGATDSARAQVLQLINPALSPDQRKGVIAAIRGGVDSKAQAQIGSNPYLRAMYSGGTTAGNTNSQNKSIPAPAPVAHKVGDTVVYNGKSYKVKAIRPDGKLELGL